MKSSKDKLDEKLGITDINDIFSQEDIDLILQDSQIAISNIDKKIKDTSNEIDNIAQNNVIAQDDKIYNLEESLKEISYLVNKSKDIISNLYSYITKTDFVDPDTISATAKMIEASRVVISDYIELYKEKLRMVHSYNMEMQKHKNRLELEERKAEIKKRYSIKDVEEKQTIELIPYVQEKLIEVLKNTQS